MLAINYNVTILLTTLLSTHNVTAVSLVRFTVMLTQVRSINFRIQQLTTNCDDVDVYVCWATVSCAIVTVLVHVIMCIMCWFMLVPVVADHQCSRSWCTAECLACTCCV